MIYPHPLPYTGFGRRGRRSGGVAHDPDAAKLHHHRKSRWKTVAAWTLLVLLSGAVALVLVFTLTVIRLRPTLPTAMQIATYAPPVGTSIYSSDGVLLARLQLENRRVVPLKEVSPDLVSATLAVEDDRFFQHGAVDPRGLARSVWANVTSGNLVGQGGSTISMQLARNVQEFGLTRQKRLTRKLREIMTAVRMEQVFSKSEILELYLNQIYYGSGAYGVEAASRTFFGKPSSKLTLSEAALIAGLPQRPEYYSPFAHRANAEKRRNAVLARMLATGRIDRARYEKAVAEPVKVRRPTPVASVYKAPYFVDWIVQDLAKKYGVDAVYGGMNIVTTLDWRMQEAAEQALRRGLSHGATQGALVCVDPHTGEVRAMVGGLDYAKDRFNAITQGRRQPGSAFKPILYAAAFDTGTVMLNDEVTDEPISTKSGKKMWTVHNYSGGYGNAPVTIKDAIVQSINTVAVKVGSDIGIDQVVRYAKAMGISTPLAPYLSLALGSSAVRPLDLCSAYEHFAAEGPRYDPIGVRSIRNSRGTDIDVPSAYERRHASPLQPATIAEINEALRAVVTEGTGYAANSVPNAFGKTGTTSDHRDAWFVGYTPELLTTVWVASPERDRQGILHYRPMDKGTGGHVAAPIWARFMQSAVPIQRRANQLRRVGPYTIFVPAPDSFEKEANEQQLAAQKKQQGEENAEKAQIASWFYGGFHGGGNAHPELGAAGGALLERRGDEIIFHPSPERGYGRISWTPAGGDTDSSEHASASADQNGCVRVCADSGLLATRWCPSTYLEDPTVGTVPRSYCRMHHAPDGE